MWMLIISAIGETVLMAPATRGCGCGLFSSPCLRLGLCYAAPNAAPYGGSVCRCFLNLLVMVSQNYSLVGVETWRYSLGLPPVYESDQ
jgi:hypothetical protein